MNDKSPAQKTLRRQRWNLLVQVDQLLNAPMNILAFVWLVLTIIDIRQGLPDLLQAVVWVIWGLFWIHFLLQLILAPDKSTYIKHNWLTALSLILPAFRMFRILRLFRYLKFIRGTSVIRILSSINRGMAVLRKKLGNTGFLYVFCLTLLVVVASSAGIMSFEVGHSKYFENFPTAMWWSAMMVTTMGSDYFPKSSEGRVLALLLAVYGFAIFGYVTARVAAFLMGKERR